MIAFLKGTVREPGVVLTGSGVGYKVISPSLLKVGEDVELEIAQVFGRDGSSTLYGFLTVAEREVFEAITKVPGVGPAAAIALLRDVGVTEINAAVVGGHPTVLAKAQGVGAKVAEKICHFVSLPKELAAALDDGRRSELIDALIALGYKEKEAFEAAGMAVESEMELAEALAEALKYLRNRR